MGTYTGSDKRLKYLFQNGGGGGGGTDVEANPQGTPTAYLNTVKIANAIYSVEKPADIYSFEERQVGVWKNGKPLYQITVDFGAIPNSSTKTVAHGVANIEEICNVWGVLNYEGIVFGETLPTGDTYKMRTAVRSTTVEMTTNASWSSYTALITFQYTKTTDVAGSGIWTPQGSYAHHYSTTEQVIGTWLDNKPLYEQAFLQTTFSANANTWYKTAIPRGSMKYLIDVFVVFENATAPSVHKGMSGGFVDGYLAINSFRNVGIDAGTTCYVVAQYTKTTD